MCDFDEINPCEDCSEDPDTCNNDPTECLLNAIETYRDGEKDAYE